MSYSNVMLDDNSLNEPAIRPSISPDLLDYDVNIVNRLNMDDLSYNANGDTTAEQPINVLELFNQYKPRIARNCYGRGKTLASMVMPRLPKCAFQAQNNTRMTTAMTNGTNLHHGMGRGSILHQRKARALSNADIHRDTDTSTTHSTAPKGLRSSHSLQTSPVTSLSSVHNGADIQPRSKSTSASAPEGSSHPPLDHNAEPSNQPCLPSSPNRSVSPADKDKSIGSTSHDSDDDAETNIECHFMEDTTTSNDKISTNITEEWTLEDENVIEIGVLLPNSDISDLRELLENISVIKSLEERTTESGHKIVRVCLGSWKSVEWAISLLDDNYYNKESDTPLYCKCVTTP